MTKTYLLFETAAGYGLYQVDNWDQIGHDASLEEMMLSQDKFTATVKFKAFQPFGTASEALENMRSLIEGQVTVLLSSFLSQNLPKKESDYSLAVVDATLGKSLSQKGFKVIYDSNVLELIRGCRLYETNRLTKLASGGTTFDMHNFQIGLGHSYSRSKLKFDPAKQDKPIINSVALLDSLTKNLNAFFMRAREWYGWHFPELYQIVSDNVKFCQVLKAIKKKEQYNFDDLEELTNITGSEEIALSIKKASRQSIGHELTDSDMLNIESFADQVIKLDKMKNNLSEYLDTKVSLVAPNLNTIVGPVVSGRLISHAGSLVNLAKAPASTIQILGAEKALFRALKSRSKTPKYGLLYQSAFIGKATNKHKGKAARYLANKCALASRLDCFCDTTTDVYGKKMNEQLTKRMEYLLGGPLPEDNMTVMKAAHEEYNSIKSERNKREREEEKEEQVPSEETKEPLESDKKKKKKQKKKEIANETAKEEGKENDSAGDLEPGDKKKKKKKKSQKEKSAQGEN
ncbi:snoRNA binding domain containing protein [Theileria equi strain WA]|uniref:Nucleolar protein 56 n=1 Tax=Theileria equi strain WA TaxID=1537102 RepID=L1LET9_THEEQ|nr:snoRNA binding domain containing protein [Theileria equi strain WA]EKX73784.1 snoRNA binding domain containing protein [Theileria equi strain WA]|eukprot:XP_004833236.1 snoRNA binding domain containing protein [Theileria equi strain WA]